MDAAARGVCTLLPADHGRWSGGAGGAVQAYREAFIAL